MKQIVKRSKIKQRTFRLLTFNPYDEEVKNSDDSEDRAENNRWAPSEKEFMIQMFGINEKGETVAIFVKGFSPFFYAKVGDDWDENTCSKFITQMRNDMGRFYENTILSSKLLSRKKLYGFDGGKNHKFVMITFSSEAAMRKAKKSVVYILHQGWCVSSETQ